MDQSKTGALIRPLRREKGLTQEQLAERLGVSRRTVSRWETGSNLPDLDLLMELSDLFAVDLRALLTGERSAQEDGEAKETARRLAAYTGEERQRLNRRLNRLFCAGALAGVVAIILSAAAIDHPVADFFTGFGQGASVGVLLAGVLMTSRLGAGIRAAKRRLLKRAK